MELKYLLIPIILLLAVGVWNFVYAHPVPTTVSPTFTNDSVWNQSWAYINITSNENLSQAFVDLFVDGGNITFNMTNSSGNTFNQTNWVVNITLINDTLAGQKTNYSILLFNTSGNMTQTGLYYITIDTATPTVHMQELNSAPGGLTIINSTNCTYGCTKENIALLTANITDNTTHTCIFRVWYETLNTSLMYPGYPNLYWTLSTTNFTGTLGGSASDQTRNCTYNLTGTELHNILTDGVVKIQAWVNDSVGKEAVSNNNLTFVFNTIPSAKWKLLGNTETAMNLGAFANYGSSGNITYVSIYKNEWDNKSYVTYRWNNSGASANKDVSMDAGNTSAAFVYSPNGWYLIRSNTSLGNPVFLYGASVLINDTKKGCASPPCDYQTTYTPMVNDVTLNVTNGTEQLFGVTVNVSNATLTNITIANTSANNITFYYEWDNARSPWNLIGCVATNTTKALAAQNVNISYISYWNASIGYYETYKKDFAFNENITINRGEAMWVLSNINSSTVVAQVNSSTADIRSSIGLLSVEWIR